MSLRKSLFEYDNYRTYLKDFYEISKTENKHFSLRYFSRLAGFKSQSVLTQVITGERNISRRSINKFIKALKLTRREATFFKNLVYLNQATTPSQKEHYAQEILRSQSYKKFHPLVEAQYNYFASWYFVLIREMVDLPGFKENSEWIAKQIRPPISPGDAKRALEELLKLGLLQRDKGGKLVQSSSIVITPDEVASSAIAKYHKEMMARAQESIDKVPREMRDISAQTFGISKETAKTIKEMIQNFRTNILEVVSREQKADSVYQLNFQLFPLAVPKDDG